MEAQDERPDSMDVYASYRRMPRPPAIAFGVCAGVAYHLGVSVRAVRFVVVLLACLLTPAFMYLGLCLFTPLAVRLPRDFDERTRRR